VRHLVIEILGVRIMGHAEEIVLLNAEHDGAVRRRDRPPRAAPFRGRPLAIPPPQPETPQSPWSRGMAAGRVFAAITMRQAPYPYTSSPLMRMSGNGRRSSALAM